ncbi:polysaccharide deacetylase family protein [Marinifilum caeruleilacunae]|uniref:Polysaccharide deacetylase family protein n=1 Tax=Marinifilum caeruleilacunae TaxID=2499076 RepID=A0ABX1WT57_9BACT|nr:polysaccharide deacetylase family protein [Marinifilum caeruleilacunae]NOU59280.1 polysaccharide deacetylase family protein [Marinifilum caeruleilacunae]
MNTLKKYIADILGFVLLLIFEKSALKRFDKQVLSIYFHNPSLLLFKGIIRYLLSKGFSFISENDYYKIINGEKQAEERSAFVSFDDGWKGNLKLIPFLEKYQIPATFFIPVRPVMTGNFWWEYAPIVISENPDFTSLDELKQLPNHKRLSLIRDAAANYDLKRSCIDLSELKRLSENPLISIGSHTYHHPITIQCSDAELEFEYRESKKALEEWLSVEIQSFSFPNGDYNQRDLALLKQYNYRMAFTVNPDLETNAISEYQIPRVSINSKGGKYENIARMLRVWHRFVQPLQHKPLFGFKPKLSGS